MLVGVAVGVCVGVFVGVAVEVLVGVCVGVNVGVAVGVLVGVSVGVFVSVLVGVDVGVLVGVFVARLLRHVPLQNPGVAWMQTSNRSKSDVQESATPGEEQIPPEQHPSIVALKLVQAAAQPAQLKASRALQVFDAPPWHMQQSACATGATSSNPASVTTASVACRPISPPSARHRIPTVETTGAWRRCLMEGEQRQMSA